MKTLLFTISILYSFASPGYSCSILCLIPSKLDKSVFIGEGKIVGYSGNYTHEDVIGEIGMVEIEITILYYPGKMIKRLFISEFGSNSSCVPIGYSKETLMKYFPINQLVTFVGRRSNMLGDSILLITTSPCGTAVLGSMENRLRFDYESQRRGVSLKHGLMEEFYQAMGYAYWDNQEDLIASKKMLEKKISEIYIPEKIQIFLDLIHVSQSRTKEGRFYILKELVWSNEIFNLKFIQHQKISKKQKALLIAEEAYIRENWPSR